VKWKLGLGAVAAAAVGILRFAVLKDTQAKWLILIFGYWLVAATTGLFGILLWRRLRAIDWSKQFWRTHTAGLICVLACSIFLQVNEQRGYKVLFDEYVIAGVARNMHFNREATFPARAHYFNGRLLVFESGIDKRPFFFAFLVSLVHDLTGYHEANVFYLNAVLAATLLALVYFLGYRIGGVRYGCLGVLLLTTLPLLAQNATGAGFEVVNMVMICVLLLAGADYLQSPGAKGLDLFVLTGVLLAQARYESILYVLVVGAAVLVKWWRTREIQLTWLSATAPLWLIIPLLVNEVGLDDPTRFQLKAGQKAFALANLPDNLNHALYYLFNWDIDSTNSFLLSALGMIALVFLVWLLAKNFVRNLRTGGDDLILTFAGMVVGSNIVIALTYFWGHWDDVMVSRFSLPLQLMLALAVLRVTREFFKQRAVPWPALFAVWAWIFLVTAPAEARHFASSDIVTVQEYNWYHDYLAKKSPAETLSVVSSSIAPILQNYPAISVDEAKAAQWQLKACLEGEFYREVLVLQRFQIDKQTGKLFEIGPSQLGDKFVLQTLAERRVRPDIISRISRLIDVKEKVKPPARFEAEKLPFKDDEELVGHLLRKLP